MNDDRPGRQTRIAKPDEERTTDESAPKVAGPHGSLRGVKPGPGPELAHESDADDVLSRNAKGRYQTPRTYDEDDREATMPTNDSTLNTKI